MSMAWICYKKYGLFFFERVHSMGFILAKNGLSEYYLGFNYPYCDTQIHM